MEDRMARKATSYSFAHIYGYEKAFMQRAGVIPVPTWRRVARAAAPFVLLAALGAFAWLALAAFGGGVR
jgi:hypothetical protein